MILGFQDIHKTLQRQVKKAYKCSLKSLEYPPDYASSLSYHEGRAVYISELGLCHLVQSCRLHSAAEFARKMNLPVVKVLSKEQNRLNHAVFYWLVYVGVDNSEKLLIHLITSHFDERESSVIDLTKMSEGEMVTVLRERLDAFKRRERVS